MTARRTMRCAIYTRKSSEEGLDQEFNSLEAQREACAAYITSQKGEGWKLLARRYDDGGISGGHMERPALQALLDDIDAGLVDMVVVYKIDRLTRSLADFARLVERFEAADCSFVSVTQAFNTSTSMGRLTLNVLLSFAQFEREVTAERIRDKIAASKKKGMWMGGRVPLGYRANERTLAIDETEARLVREIYALYSKEGCLRRVEDILTSRGARTASRTLKDGRKAGGRVFSRGHLHRILTSPLYAGQISHKGEVYEGLHDAIINKAEWETVQTLLRDQSAHRRRRNTPSDLKSHPEHASPLRGKVFDETGDRLTPSHTSVRGKRIRYYVSRRLITGPVGTATPSGKVDDGPVAAATKGRKSGGSQVATATNGLKPDGRTVAPATHGSGWRLPAIALENSIAQTLRQHLGSLSHSGRLLRSPTPQGLAALTIKIADLIRLLDQDPPTALETLAQRIDIAPGSLQIKISPGGLSHLLGLEINEFDETHLSVSSPFTIRRRGIEAKIVTGAESADIDTVLLREVARAISWREQIEDGRTPKDIADELGWSTAPLRKRIKLACLSPKLIEAILQGKQLPDQSVNALIHADIPMNWADQERQFGV